jgi:hypothetical protein
VSPAPNGIAMGSVAVMIGGLPCRTTRGRQHARHPDRARPRLSHRDHRRLTAAPDTAIFSENCRQIAPIRHYSSNLPTVSRGVTDQRGAIPPGEGAPAEGLACRSAGDYAPGNCALGTAPFDRAAFGLV